MKNNPIAFDELGNQIAKLDGSPLPQEKWEEKGEKIPFHFRTCPKNNWRDRFDDKFGVEETTEYYQEMARRIKQFISGLLKEQEELFEERVIDKIDELMVYAKQNKKDYETVNEAHFAIAQLKSLLKKYENNYK